MDLPKTLVLVITVLVTLVLPAEVITYYSNNAKSEEEVVDESDEENPKVEPEGQVAGVTTDTESSDSSQSVENSKVINARSTPFIIMGIFFFVVSLSITGYLVAFNPKEKS